MAVDVLWSLPVLMVLSAVHEVQSHRGSHGLSCTNDFFNNVTCTWNQSSVGPGVDCWVSGVKNGWDQEKNREQHITRSCRLKQQLDSVPGCSFVFENKEFYSFETMPNISVWCNGMLVDVMQNYKPRSHIKMQPPGAPNVSSTANDTWIWWRLSGPVSDFFTSLDFQVQVKRMRQAWEEATKLSTQQEEVRIPAEFLKGGGQVRVRVRPGDRWESHWSSWSPTTSWVGAGDRLDLSDNEVWQLDQTSLITMALMLAVLVIAVTLFRSCWTRGPLTGKPIPTPLKYFHTLHSVHGGNLKTWLNPQSVSQSFFMAQSCDQISPVQVCQGWDVPSVSPSFSSTSALLRFQSYPSAGSDTSGVVDNSSSSSCFSNVGYFMSSSGSVLSDHSLAYFTYQDLFQNSPNLPSSLSPLLATHESLMWQPKSLDFGLPIREPGGADMGLEEEKVLDEQSSPLLIIPFNLPSLVCPSSPPSPPPPPPPPPPSVIQISPDSQQVELPVPADSGSSDTWLVAGAMCRSSSMPVEPSKNGYLTLKELQMTFSNKSI